MDESLRKSLLEQFEHHRGAINSGDWAHLSGNILGGILNQMRIENIPWQEGDEIAQLFTEQTGMRVYFAHLGNKGPEFYRPEDIKD